MLVGVGVGVGVGRVSTMAGDEVGGGCGHLEHQGDQQAT